MLKKIILTSGLKSAAGSFVYWMQIFCHRKAHNDRHWWSNVCLGVTRGQNLKKKKRLIRSTEPFWKFWKLDILLGQKRLERCSLSTNELVVLQGLICLPVSVFERQRKWICTLILHSRVCAQWGTLALSHLYLCSFIYRPCALGFVMEAPRGKGRSNMTFSYCLSD